MEEARLFFKWANPGLFLFYFRPFLIIISIIQIEKCVDSVFGIWTHGRRQYHGGKQDCCNSTCFPWRCSSWRSSNVKSNQSLTSRVPSKSFYDCDTLQKSFNIIMIWYKKIQPLPSYKLLSILSLSLSLSLFFILSFAKVSVFMSIYS